MWHKRKLCTDQVRYFSRRLMKSTLLRHKIRPPSPVMHCGANTASSVLIKVSSCITPQILQTGLISDCLMVELLSPWTKVMGLWEVNWVRASEPEYYVFNSLGESESRQAVMPRWNNPYMYHNDTNSLELDNYTGIYIRDLINLVCQGLLPSCQSCWFCKWVHGTEDMIWNQNISHSDVSVRGLIYSNFYSDLPSASSAQSE